MPFPSQNLETQSSFASGVDMAVSRVATPLSNSQQPDGGLRAWGTVLGSFLAVFCCFGHANAYGVYQDYYTQYYLINESASAISWIGTTNVYLVMLGGLISGALHDRGYFYHVFIGGAILQSFSLFMLSLAHPGRYYQIFLAQGLGSGIAQGLMFVPSLAVLSQHFRQRKTLVMAIVMSGATIGGAVYTIMLNSLINGPMGFSKGVRASAVVETALLLVACLITRTGVECPPPSVNFRKVAKSCFSEAPFILTMIGFACFEVGYVYVLFYFQTDSIKHGLSSTFSFYSLVILNLSSVFGQLGAGFLPMLIGVLDTTIAALIVTAVLIFGMIWLGSVSSVVIIGVLFGIASGISISIIAPVIAFLTRDPSELGTRLGIAYPVLGLGALVGPPIAGALLTDRYIWWAPSVFCGTVVLLGAVLFIVLRILELRKARKGADGRME
ncbi:hypothetical protein HYDPIDRAFT_113601 [Hydnomerulius pinastri MD-312]|uniref:Unplaced genomic scaffold scaffold_18, whole genome shotgun sequence n=1 Tax=Hydnomerulius pinastri MD-312 TaxID=994086 RepID=A0A0C9VXS2_9AGAM|nr:hypothetical protein HYDPIDRAFT_113601 [Hydnomerulius pinastri MD-312]